MLRHQLGKLGGVGIVWRGTTARKGEGPDDIGSSLLGFAFRVGIDHVPDQCLSRCALPATTGWKTRSVTCSAFELPTLESLWETIEEFRDITQESGVFADRRKQQSIEWMHAMIAEELRNRFLRSERIQALLPEIEQQVANNTLPAASAVNQIMREM